MTKKKGFSTTQRGWSKFVRRPEPDLPANLNTKRFKPGDEGWPFPGVTEEQLLAAYSNAKEREPTANPKFCVHTRQSVGFVSGRFFQRCLDCGRVVPVDE